MKILHHYGINSIWHFTDKSNLQSIADNGLLSLQGIKKNNIDVTRFGADSLSHSLDQMMGLDDFVHLAFIHDHPMYHIAKKRGSIVEPMWIEYDISLLFQEGVKFANKVANGSGSPLFEVNEIEKHIDFEAMMHDNDFYNRVQARKAEILIPNLIDSKYVKGVYYGK